MIQSLKYFAKYVTIVLIVFSTVFIQSCNRNDDEFLPRVLVEANLFLNRSANDLKLIAPSLNIPANAMKYDVDIYRVTYKTPYKNNEIIASGIVVLPRTTDEVGMLCFNHGTIASNSEAPTQLGISNQQWFLFAAMASPGFIAVIPDFIGFGASVDIFHPYYDESLTATAIYDNMVAAAELARQNDVRFNKKLFISGYSQGGYATMAAHKYVEQNPSGDFNLIASFPASGGYDVKAMQEYFFGLETYDQPFFLAYVALAYKNTYDWSEGMDVFFNEPYAGRIPNLFNNVNTGSQINAQLNNNIAEFVKADFLNNIDTDNKYKFIVDAFNDNSLTDWTPTKPIYMYHGTADVTVPYENSVITYEKLLARGTPASLLSFIPLEGAMHFTGPFPYIQDFVNKVLDMK
ncbi:MAG TPA: prolyl oligopeptidase family serine peptidase [Cyclobacteriaceae bacterium]|nr:prolyl oligopeptidase family serine peptidase [Cyclobacteriaceae bacterium]